jgi:pimeloyl-ACP methyl ester carboxylesterase
MIDGPDCRLWVDVMGEGEPVTVVAHGITSCSEEIAYFAHNAAGTRVLFDFRGHGRSESPPEEAGYDYPAMRRDLEFVADRYTATRAFGVSLGAGAILNLVADRPDRFDRIALFIPARIDSAHEAAKDRYPPLAHLLETLTLEEVADLAMAAPESKPLFETRPQWRHLIRARIMRMNSTGVPRALRASVDGAQPLTNASVLRRVTAPTLILAHQGDPLHPEHVARRLAELLPNAELRMWPEPLAMLDDPLGFAKEVGAFLSGDGAER